MDLVRPRTSGPLSPRAIKRNQLLRLRRGVYVPASCIPEGAPRGEVCRQLTIVRALAVDLAMDVRPGPEFTMEAALMMHGLRVWSPVPDIVFRRYGSESRRSPKQMPAINWRGIVVPGVVERQLVSTNETGNSIYVGDVRTAPFVQIAVDCARYLHPMPATVAVSAVLRWLSFLDRSDARSGRSIEADCRMEMLSLVAKLANHGSTRAREVVLAADAGVEDAEHGCLLWILQCMLSHMSAPMMGGKPGTASTPGADLVTQHEIKAFGRRYFAAFAIPSRRVAIELDRREENCGEENRGEGTRGTRSDVLQRHRDMTNAGWMVIRVGRRQLYHPEQLVGRLLRELQRCGVRVLQPAGGLWWPVPQELLGEGN